MNGWGAVSKNFHMKMYHPYTYTINAEILKGHPAEDRAADKYILRMIKLQLSVIYWVIILLTAAFYATGKIKGSGAILAFYKNVN